VLQAALVAPSAALESPNPEFAGILQRSQSPAIQELYKLTQKVEELQQRHDPSSRAGLEEIDKYRRAAALLDNIVQGKYTVDEALKRAAFPDANYLKELLEIEARPKHLGDASIRPEIEYIALRTIEGVNRLHEQPDQVRFKAIEGLSARQILRLAVEGEEEMYTSTFNGFYDRMMRRCRDENLIPLRFWPNYPQTRPGHL